MSHDVNNELHGAEQIATTEDNSHEEDSRVGLEHYFTVEQKDSRIDFEHSFADEEDSSRIGLEPAESEEESSRIGLKHNFTVEEKESRFGLEHKFTVEEEDSRIGLEHSYTVEDEDPSKITLSSTTDTTILQNGSPNFRGRMADSEPVTVVVDPLEANKNFLRELERTRERNNVMEFEIGRAYSRNTVLSVSADSLLKYPNSRYYKA